jgi:putative hemolysin
MENPVPNDIDNTSSLSIPEGTILTDTLLQVIKYSRLNKIYSEAHDKDPIILINSLLDLLDLNIDLPEEDLKNIPAEGAFIAVSNHPFRGIDSMLLFKLIYEKRRDFKIMASHLLQNIEPLRDIIIPVNTYENKKTGKSSFSGIKEGLNHIKEGHCFGIFPAADDSRHWEAPKVILDHEWKITALKYVRSANIQVIPVYFHGTKSRLSYILNKINPLLRNTELPEELINKKKRTIKIRIGAPITPKEQSSFESIAHFGQYLRARVYSLGSTIDPKLQKREGNKWKKRKVETIVSPVPSQILTKEFNSIRDKYELFSTKNYSVLCTPIHVIPKIFNEIGRLREVTFREVGEGTNKSIDIDEYDFYYNHLFIWDTDKNRIVGAYRLGKGRDISATYGLKGFYINSLFRIKKGFLPILSESIELGRSFVTKDYQKKVIPLFLLWKGIMIFLLKNSEYRYLIGPVSISNDLSRFSQSLIVEFFKTYFFSRELSGYILPKKDFKLKPDKVIDTKIFIDTAEKDINKIEHIIEDIEPGYHIPVLLKKYMELNARIIGFNIDPKFNNCLDGFMILDLFEVPKEYISGLSREMNDPSVFERFRAV